MADMAFNIIHVSNMDIHLDNALPTTIVLFLSITLLYITVLIRQEGQRVANLQEGQEPEDPPEQE